MQSVFMLFLLDSENSVLKTHPQVYCARYCTIFLSVQSSMKMDENKNYHANDVSYF